MVLTVPMRNGNNNTIVDSVGNVYVLTVPMRNGNSLDFRDTFVLYYGSYRTYEEWKRY